MSATETFDFEHEFGELVRELRALPTAAPERLRERVRALGEPAQQPRLFDRVRMVSVRRSLFVLAPACVPGLVVAAVIHGVVNSGGQRQAVAKAHVAAAGAGAPARTAPQDKQVFGALTQQQPFASPL